MKIESLVKSLQTIWNQIITNDFLKWENLSVTQKEKIINQFNTDSDYTYCEIKFKLAMYLMSLR